MSVTDRVRSVEGGVEVNPSTTKVRWTEVLRTRVRVVEVVQHTRTASGVRIGHGPGILPSTYGRVIQWIEVIRLIVWGFICVGLGTPGTFTMDTPFSPKRRH